MSILRRLSVLPGRPCSLAVRVALFVVFAGALTYMDAANVRSWSAVNPNMNVSYRTINAGHPFYIYAGDVNDLQQPGKTDPAKLMPYFKVLFNDGGILLSMSGLRLGLDALGSLEGYQFNDYQFPFFAYVAMLVFGASLMLVTLPLAVAILAYIPLLQVTLDYSDKLGSDARTVEAFGLAILGVYALVLVFSRWRRGTVIFIVTTTLFVAWLNLIRQGLIDQKLLLDALLIAFFVVSALVRRLRRSGYHKKPAALEARKALAIALSFPVAFAYTVALSLFLSKYYGLPYSSNYIPSHGSGHPLYLSTGYVANPFNIAWDDDIFQVNYITISDRFFRWSYPEWSEVSQPALRNEYKRVVAEDPMLFVRNVVEKTKLTHRYLTDPSIPGILPFDLIYVPAESQRFMYRAAMLGLVLLAGVAFLPSCRWLWNAIFPMLALVAVSLVPPLVVSPGYLLGFLGAMSSICFAWFGACAAGLVFGGRLRLANGRAAGRSAVLVGAGVTLVLLLFGLYVGFREVYNARQDARLLAENPYDVMREKGYRFAEGFNRLKLADQQRAIRRLLTIRPEGANVEVFCRADPEIHGQLGPASPELHTSICAFILDEPWRRNFRVAMVLNYFSDKWHEVLPRRDQGPVGSNVTLGSVESCPEQPRRAAKYWWDPPTQLVAKCVYIRFANGNWQGKFYMNLLPVGKGFTNGADTLTASTHEIVGPPTNSELFYVEREVGSTRLERYDGANRRRTTTTDAETTQSLSR